MFGDYLIGDEVMCVCQWKSICMAGNFELKELNFTILVAIIIFDFKDKSFK